MIRNLSEFPTTKIFKNPLAGKENSAFAQLRKLLGVFIFIQVIYLQYLRVFKNH